MNDQTTQPGFSHEAAAVLNAAYFFDTDGLQERFPDEEAFILETDRRWEEHAKLAEILPNVDSFDQLPEEIKGIWRKVQRWDEGESVWQERIGGETSFGMSVPASDLDGMNIPQEDGDLLAAAILQAHEDGDQETAEKLGLMADSPWQIQEAFGGSSPVVRKDDKQEQVKTEPKLPSVPKSPFAPKKP